MFEADLIAVVGDAARLMAARNTVSVRCSGLTPAAVEVSVSFE